MSEKRFLEAPFVRMLRMRSASLKNPDIEITNNRGGLFFVVPSLKRL